MTRVWEARALWASASEECTGCRDSVPHAGEGGARVQTGDKMGEGQLLSSKWRINPEQRWAPRYRLSINWAGSRVCLCVCVLVCLCACVLVCLCACVLVCVHGGDAGYPPEFNFTHGKAFSPWKCCNSSFDNREAADPKKAVW